MKQLFILTLLSGLFLSPLPAQNEPPAETPPASSIQSEPLATAVLDFQTSDGTLQKQGTEIALLLQAELSTQEHAIMVERQEIDKILGEQELGKSGLVSADTAAKIGALTGAQVLVTGRVFASGDQYLVVAKIISTETSRVYGVTSTLPDLKDLPKAAKEISVKIDSVLAKNRSVLVVKEETPAERLQRLKTLVGKEPLPSVMVKIEERDYTQPTIDPAAQTEIMLLLKELGYTVIDSDQSVKKADIYISGEAFSERGSRHGNLVSSRARVELKAVRTKSGELLWTDRQTEVAVDIGERTAGKTALQKAAARITERLLPKLLK